MVERIKSSEQDVKSPLGEYFASIAESAGGGKEILSGVERRSERQYKYRVNHVGEFIERLNALGGIPGPDGWAQQTDTYLLDAGAKPGWMTEAVCYRSVVPLVNYEALSDEHDAGVDLDFDGEIHMLIYKTNPHTKQSENMREVYALSSTDDEVGLNIETSIYGSLVDNNLAMYKVRKVRRPYIIPYNGQHIVVNIDTDVVVTKEGDNDRHTVSEPISGNFVEVTIPEQLLADTDSVMRSLGVDGEPMDKPYIAMESNDSRLYLDKHLAVRALKLGEHENLEWISYTYKPYYYDASRPDSPFVNGIDPDKLKGLNIEARKHLMGIMHDICHRLGNDGDIEGARNSDDGGGSTKFVHRDDYDVFRHFSVIEDKLEGTRVFRVDGSKLVKRIIFSSSKIKGENRYAVFLHFAGSYGEYNNYIDKHHKRK